MRPPSRECVPHEILSFRSVTGAPPRTRAGRSSRGSASAGTPRGTAGTARRVRGTSARSASSSASRSGASEAFSRLPKGRRCREARPRQSLRLRPFPRPAYTFTTGHAPTPRLVSRSPPSPTPKRGSRHRPGGSPSPRSRRASPTILEKRTNEPRRVVSVNYVGG